MVMPVCEHNHWARLILRVNVLHFQQLGPACYMHAIQDVFWMGTVLTFTALMGSTVMWYLHGYSYSDHALKF